MYKPIFPEGKSVEFYDNFFNQYLSKLAMDQLPKSRPLWEIHIIKYPTKNSAGNIVFKLQHALGDGFSLMGALLSCLQRVENHQLPLTFTALMNENMNIDDDHKGIFKNVTSIFNTVSDFGWSLLKSSVIEDDKSPIRSGDVRVEFRPITITTMTFSLNQIKKMKEILEVVRLYFFFATAGRRRWFDVKVVVGEDWGLDIGYTLTRSEIRAPNLGEVGCRWTGTRSRRLREK
ncbi:O-acyltransferase WSD1-like [Olea europaea var. sylvestris]|uniref:O-acyltransferase WSD1-like n=1 Tax=Olea europaea var. sylvestris TaxID=158386 RepID=UPI000C1CEEE9|nr:O-acyltransferase WSD1-like [Olea europaea var. sylvestris]